jgi:transcriptional regulator with XRE-family HTH domain
MRKNNQHKNTLLSHLGDAIRNRRVDIGITQQELATETELHRTYITDVEGGNRNISMLTYGRLTQALKCALSLPLLETERSMARESGLSVYGLNGALTKASKLLHLRNEFCLTLDIIACELQVKANMSRLQVCVESYLRKLSRYPTDDAGLVEALLGQLPVNPFSKTAERPSIGTAVDEGVATSIAANLRPGEIEYSPIKKGVNYIIRGGGANGQVLAGNTSGSFYVLSGNLRTDNQP